MGQYDAEAAVRLEARLGAVQRAATVDVVVGLEETVPQHHVGEAAARKATRDDQCFFRTERIGRHGVGVVACLKLIRIMLKCFGAAIE